jgi:6-phosphogluconolactonase
MTDDCRQENMCPALSRRTFIKGAAAFQFARAAYASQAEPGKVLVYVGTDTKPVDGAANGKGIYLFEMEPESGELKLVGLAAETVSPSWLTLHPSGKYLYCVNEVSDYQGDSGSVSAFAIDQSTGELSALNTVSSHGAGPTHISVDHTGAYAFVANYYGGTVAVIPIQRDGRLREAAYVHRDEGSLGAERATNAPRGSFAISGHDTPHAHMIQPDPENLFVLQTDMGQDRIYVYQFNKADGQLTAAKTPFVELPSGDGPRHFVFHPSGQWMYAIQEEASTIALFRYHSSSGALTPLQTVSTLPPGFTGTSFASDVMISRDGLFLYALNRLHNSVAIFSVGPDGMLTRVGEVWTEGDYPNHCAMDPTGRFLYVCNQRSDQITSFRADRRTGLLTSTGRYQPLGTPVCMAFLTRNA